MPTAAHTHATGLFLITMMAALVVVHVTVHTFAALFPDSPRAKALAYSIP